MLSGLKRYYFEIGSIRPPGEGGSNSLLLRITRNCPWNRCKFCYGSPYNRESFQLRTVEDLKEDIDVIREISDEIRRTLDELNGTVNQRVVDFVISGNPEVYVCRPKEELNLRIQSLINVAFWLRSGAKTVFLQDANSLVMKTAKLVEVLEYLKKTFPSIERITSYARSKTIAMKSQAELNDLYNAGLSRLHVGLESGDDVVLKYMEKGVTSKEHILAGKKAKKAGFELSLYVMPGLGGKIWSLNHAKNTALVLNEIDPDYIRFRPLVPRIGTPLYKEWQEGGFQLLSPHEILREIEIMIKDLNITGRVCFDHVRNPSYRRAGLFIPLFKQDYGGYKSPEEKSRVLKLIEEGLKIDESHYMPVEYLIEAERDFYKIEKRKGS